MKNLTEKFKNNWRKLISAFFILTAFLMPATRDFLSEIFNVTTYASNNKNNEKNNNHSNSTKSESVKSVSSPDSQDTASPMKNSMNDSTNGNTQSNGKKDKPNGK